jgi:DNA mismatch repair protein MutH
MSPVFGEQPFEFRTASAEGILELARELLGLTLGEIPGARFTALEARRGKGEAGLAVEAFFGIPPNALAEADFPAAGIELKVVPLVRNAGGLRVKERTVISMIDFNELIEESWETAHVRRKLHILFVFFEHLYGEPKQRFPILGCTMWKPSGEVLRTVRADWERVRRKVAAGLAHELSESDGEILGPCTKGTDSRHLRRQPRSKEMARSRAFALKPFFTLALYLESLKVKPDNKRLAELASSTELVHRFRGFVGRSIGDVGEELGIAPNASKSYAASVVRAAIRASSSVPRDEFTRTGPTVRMSRIGPDLLPYEALSFPAFRQVELADETWEDSALLEKVEHMLIVPVYGPTKQTPQGDCVLREPIYWHPSAEQLEVIQREWTKFRDLIAEGKHESLPKESQTTAIHVRPHGRDALDVDHTVSGRPVTKKSFWLNKEFVQGILRSARSTR